MIQFRNSEQNRNANSQQLSGRGQTKINVDPFSESLSKILLFITTFKIFQSKNRLVGIKYKQAVYNCKNNLSN